MSLRKVFISICYVIFLTLQASAQPKDLEGWGKTNWEMTEEQLLSLFAGQIEHLPKDRGRDTGCPGGGGCTTLQINDIEIDGFHYKVWLRISDTTRKLGSVDLIAKGDAPGAFNSLKQMLMQKYGVATSSQMTIPQFTWIFPSTVIELTYIEMMIPGRYVVTTSATYKPNKKEGNL